MSTYFGFIFSQPNADYMIEAAQNATAEFDYQSIVYYGSKYCGYGNIVPSDLTQSEMDSLMSSIETVTGLPVDGPYTESDISTTQSQ